MLTRAELPLVEVAGTPEEMGRQLGEARRDSIHAMLAKVKRNLAEPILPFGTGLDEAELAEEARRYLVHVERDAPTVFAELRGMSAGAGIALEDAYLMQVPFGNGGLILAAKDWQEPGRHLEAYEKQKHSQATMAGGCSTFSVGPEAAAGGKVLIGQTCDFYPDYKEHWIVLRKAPDDAPAQLNAVPSGMLTWGNGFNEAGIGVDYNSLNYTDARYGLTPIVIGRLLMDQGTLDDAIAVATGPGRAAGWNWMLADAAGTMVDVETTATDHEVRVSEEGILTHANCYLTPRFIGGDVSLQLSTDSHLRTNRLWQMLSLKAGEIDVDYIKSCYEDHVNQPGAICRHAIEDEPAERNFDTNVLTISDLKNRKLYVCLGPVCEHELVEYSL